MPRANPQPTQYQSLLVGAALLAATAFACYALFRCARRRAREEYAVEMAQVQVERAEIDAAAATAATAEEGAASPSSADRPKRALKPALLARLPTFTYQDPVPKQGEGVGASTADAAAPPPGDTSTTTATAATPRTESGRRCIICMDPLAGQRCVTLPCGHIFHAENCALPWLANEDGTCPECRLDVGASLRFPTALQREGHRL